MAFDPPERESSVTPPEPMRATGRPWIGLTGSGWRLLVVGLGVLAQILFLERAQACEPAVPLLMIFGGNWFYAVIGLPVVIAAKCVAFSVLEKDLKRGEALRWMALANIYSTVFGFLAVAALAVPVMAFVSPLFIFGASLVPATRILRHVNWAENRLVVRRWGIALGFALGFLASIILFELAEATRDQRSYLGYWILKFGYATVGMMISILMGACWEERAIAGLAATRYPDTSYLVSVIRANYIAFMILLAIGALVMLPTRLRTEGFLFPY